MRIASSSIAPMLYDAAPWLSAAVDTGNTSFSSGPSSLPGGLNCCGSLPASGVLRTPSSRPEKKYLLCVPPGSRSSACTRASTSDSGASSEHRSRQPLLRRSSEGDGRPARADAQRRSEPTVRPTSSALTYALAPSRPTSSSRMPPRSLAPTSSTWARGRTSGRLRTPPR